MKNIFFSLFLLLATQYITAQESIYEYKDDNKYCTIELELNSEAEEGWAIYRALNFYSIPYFEITFIAKPYVSESGESMIRLSPTFYSHAYLHQVYGEAEAANSSSVQNISFIFANNGSSLNNRTTDEEEKEILRNSSFKRKDEVDITSIPSEFNKTNEIDWTQYPKKLKKNLEKRIKLRKKRIR